MNKEEKNEITQKSADLMRADFVEHWNKQIGAFYGLLDHTSDYEQYKKLSKKIDRIQQQLEEIVKMLSLNI